MKGVLGLLILSIIIYSVWIIWEIFQMKKQERDFDKIIKRNEEREKELFNKKTK